MRKHFDNSAPARETSLPAGLEQSAARVPLRLSIGGVEISPATVLAPMAGVTDTVFRRFIRNLGGCGLIMTEFTSADGVLRGKDKKAKRYLHFYEDEHPISAQLFGSNPQVMADAARMVEDLGFDLVDLNLGCPAKKVVKCNGGSGLLRDLPLIGEIFRKVRAAVSIPFTVKFRAGWNDDEIVCVELAKMAEDCGLAAVALHARTREQGYSGNARWEWIAAVKSAVNIPVIGNGDIRSPEDACAMVAQTGCDAVMIGRMAPSNPWIFRQIEQYITRTTSVCHPEEPGFGDEGPGRAAGYASALGEDNNRGSGIDCHPEEPGFGDEGPGRAARYASALGEDNNRGSGIDCHPEERGFGDEGPGRAAGYASALGEDNNRGSGIDCHPEEPGFGDEGPGRAARSPNALREDNNRAPGTLPCTLPYDHPTEADRYQMIRTYFSMLIEEGFPDAEGKMKQFASWFTHGVPGGAALRKQIYESKSAPEILSRVETFFEARLGAATLSSISS